MTRRTHQELLDAGVRSGHEYVESFNDLEENWDGEGATTVEPRAIELAHKIMNVIGEDKFVCPDNEGTIMFEWDIDKDGENLGLVNTRGSVPIAGTYIIEIYYIPYGKPTSTRGRRLGA
jgi:hypothetical protein